MASDRPKIKIPLLSKWLSSYARVHVNGTLVDRRVSRRKLYAQDTGGADVGYHALRKLYDSLSNVTDYDLKNLNLGDLQNYVFSTANINRKVRYYLYDLIEEWNPEVSVALDTVADEVCIRGLNNEILDVIVSKADGTEPSEEEETELSSMQAVLKNFLFNDLDISRRGWSIARNLAKYGDWFMEPIIGERGVVDLKPFYDLADIVKIETEENVPYYLYLPGQDSKGQALNVARDYTSSFIWQPAALSHFTPASASKYILYFDAELIHFKLDGKPQYRPYGTSHLDSLRQTWEILKRLEDSVMVYHITRAPERRIFYIPTGKLPATQALAYLNKIKSSLKRQPSAGAFDLKGGQYSSIEDLDKRFRFVGMDEDYWIPVPEGGEGAKIDTLPGAANLESMIGILGYFLQKIYTALRIPKAYLSREEDVNRSTLVQQDVHFAKLVTRFQEAISEGLETLCTMQLFAWYSGMEANSEDLDKVKKMLDKYSITFRWTSASFIEENARAEGLKLKAEVAEIMKNTFGDQAKYYIMKKIFQMTPEEEELILAGGEEPPMQGGAEGTIGSIGEGEPIGGGGSTATPFGEMPGGGGLGGGAELGAGLETAGGTTPAPAAPTGEAFAAKIEGMLKLLKEIEVKHKVTKVGFKGLSKYAKRRLASFLEAKFSKEMSETVPGKQGKLLIETAVSRIQDPDFLIRLLKEAATQGIASRSGYIGDFDEVPLPDSEHEEYTSDDDNSE